MAFRIKRKWEGRGAFGRSNELEAFYLVLGDPNPSTDNADDESAAASWFLTHGGVPQEILLPGAAKILAADQIGYANDIRYDHWASGVYLFVVTYLTQAEFWPTGLTAFAFSTTGGTQHITRSLVPSTNYYLGDTTGYTDGDGLLNVDEDGKVRGIDRDVAGFDFQITIYDENPSSAYVLLLQALTDTVSSTVFTATIDGITFTFPIGTVRFKGASGARRGYGDMEVTLNFTATRNLTGLVIGAGANLVGPGAGINKKGQDYLEVQYGPYTDPHYPRITQRPVAVSTNQIYEYENWTGLIPGIF